MAEDFQAAVCGGGWWTSPRAAITGNFEGGCWQSHHDMKAKSSDESSDSSMIFQGSGATTMSPDSAFPVMGIHRSPPITTNGYNNWDRSLLGVNGRNYNQTAPEILSNFPATGEDSPGQLGFSMDQQNPLNFITSSGDCTSTLDTCTTSFPISYPSSLLQTYFDSNSPPPLPPPPPPPPMYDFQANLNDFNSIQSVPKQHVHGSFHLANKAPFWDASVSVSDDRRASFFASTRPQFRSSTFEEKPNCSNITIKSQHEEIRDSGSSVKKSSGEPTFKRPRLETPSPLPTFKVRKEKLGDRITALQQLVSPFGKTDTASVLHEAIEYIKLLHDQVNVLSTPYLKNGATTSQQQIQDKVKDVKNARRDLKSRGLCLVPISSTFSVTETAPEFWTPSFVGTFR